MSVKAQDVVAVFQALAQAGVTAQRLAELYNQPDRGLAEVEAILDQTDETIQRAIEED